MSCVFDRERLTGYFDGELDGAEKAQVESHISGCSECLRELEEIKSAAVMVRELPRFRAPRSIAEGVSREIAAAGRVHSFDRLRRRLLWAAGAAAALLVILNVVFFVGRDAAPPSGGVAMAPDPSAETAAALGAATRDSRAEKEAGQARRMKREDPADSGQGRALTKAAPEGGKNALPQAELQKGFAGAPKPSAPPPVAEPAPSAPRAPAAAKPAESLKREMKKAPETKLEKAKEQNAQDAARDKALLLDQVQAERKDRAPLEYVFVAADTALARRTCETLLKRMGVARVEEEARRQRKDDDAKLKQAGAAPIEVELTEAQFAALTKEMARLAKAGPAQQNAARKSAASGAAARRALAEEPEADAAPADRAAAKAAPDALRGGSATRRVILRFEPPAEPSDGKK